MQVILLEKMRHLGGLGEQVKVKPGFARNYLIPQGKAVYANAANIARFEQKRAELEAKAKERLDKALARQASIEALGEVTLVAKAGEEGKLFGSIGMRDIYEALTKMGADIEKRSIHLPQGSFRTTGQFEVFVELDSDVSATIKVNIIPEG